MTGVKGQATKRTASFSLSQRARDIVEKRNSRIKSDVVENALVLYDRYAERIEQLKAMANANDYDQLTLFDGLLDGTIKVAENSKPEGEVSPPEPMVIKEAA